MFRHNQYCVTFQVWGHRMTNSWLAHIWKPGIEFQTWRWHCTITSLSFYDKTLEFVYLFIGIKSLQNEKYSVYNGPEQSTMKRFMNDLDKSHSIKQRTQRWLFPAALDRSKHSWQKSTQWFARKGKRFVGQPKETWLSRIKRFLMSNKQHIDVSDEKEIIRLT